MNRPSRSRALLYLQVPGGSEAGFTLIELMVVVTIISVVCILAIPSMSHEGYERRAYTDAASVVEMVREARTRAIARGAAQLLVMNANSSGNAASFTLYESVTATAGADAGTMTTTSSSCNPPTLWPGTGGAQTLIDEFQFAGGLEAQGNINMRINDPQTGKEITGANLYLCFTPAGHTYYATGNAPPATFATLAPPAGGSLAALCPPNTAGCVGAVTVDVTVGTFTAGSVTGTSNSTNLIRTVWIPPSGATRITSQ